MTLNRLLKLQAILAAIYAAGLVLVPRIVIGLLSDATLGDVGTATTRLFGAALILIALLTWDTSRLTDRRSRHVIIRALFIYVTAGAILTLAGQVAGTWNRLGWVNVGSYLIFVLGYGYYLFVRPE